MQTKLAVTKKKVSSYQVPEGKHRGVFAAAYPPKDKKQGRDNKRYLKLVFTVPALENDNNTFLATATYEVTDAKDSKLMKAASVLMGRDLTAGEAKIPYPVMKAAIGKEADLDVVTSRSTKHKDPYVTIADIKPAGTWVQDSNGEFVDAAVGI